MNRADVVGGGLHGLSTALHLARMGWGVRVLEGRHVGRHCSGINAGGVRRLRWDVREIGRSAAAALGGTFVSFEDAFFRRHGHDIAALERAEQYAGQRGILNEHA